MISGLMKVAVFGNTLLPCHGDLVRGSGSFCLRVWKLFMWSGGIFFSINFISFSEAHYSTRRLLLSGFFVLSTVVFSLYPSFDSSQSFNANLEQWDAGQWIKKLIQFKNPTHSMGHFFQRPSMV